MDHKLKTMLMVITMSLRWFLITIVVALTVGIVTWDHCACRWADPSETLSGKINKLSHEHPEIPFGMGAGVVFCGLLPILPRRRRWLACFLMFIFCMSAIAAHCVWPVYQ